MRPAIFLIDCLQIEYLQVHLHFHKIAATKYLSDLKTFWSASVYIQASLKTACTVWMIIAS